MDKNDQIFDHFCPRRIFLNFVGKFQVWLQSSIFLCFFGLLFLFPVWLSSSYMYPCPVRCPFSPFACRSIMCHKFPLVLIAVLIVAPMSASSFVNERKVFTQQLKQKTCALRFIVDEPTSSKCIVAQCQCASLLPSDKQATNHLKLGQLLFQTPPGKYFVFF